jgi:hypothetical protein
MEFCFGIKQEAVKSYLSGYTKDMLQNSMVLTEQVYLFGANGIGCMVKMVSNVIPIPSQLNNICIFDGVRRNILNWPLCISKWS